MCNTGRTLISASSPLYHQAVLLATERKEELVPDQTESCDRAEQGAQIPSGYVIRKNVVVVLMADEKRELRGKLHGIEIDRACKSLPAKTLAPLWRMAIVADRYGYRDKEQMLPPMASNR